MRPTVTGLLVTLAVGLTPAVSAGQTVRRGRDSIRELRRLDREWGEAVAHRRRADDLFAGG